jgi:ribosome-associated protein
MTDSNSKKSVLQLQKIVIDALENVKAQNISVFNTEKLSPLFERVIIASGTSNRQTKALAASVRDEVREAGYGKSRVEGEENGEWIIVDCGSVVAHIMQPAIREYYHLEEIWGEKPVRFKHGEDKMSELVKERAPKPKPQPQAEQKTAKSTKPSKASSSKPKSDDKSKAHRKTDVNTTDQLQAKRGSKPVSKKSVSSITVASPGVKKAPIKAAKKASRKVASNTAAPSTTPPASTKPHNPKSAGKQDTRKKSESPPAAKPKGGLKTKETSVGANSLGKSTLSSKSIKPRASNGAPVPAKKPRNSPPRA